MTKPILDSVHLHHDQIVRAVEQASVRTCWDFNTSLGNTLGEKFESLYIKLIEVTNVLIAKGAEGFFWIVTSPEIAAMFEAAHCKLVQNEDHIRMGGKSVRHVGLLCRRWKVWCDPSMESSSVLVGVDPNIGQYGYLKIANFII